MLNGQLFPSTLASPSESALISHSNKIGGSDTTVSAVHGFVKAMVMFPEVQAQAQAEIDAVVGNDRLPDFSDKDHLPYINALVLEVTRWHTTAPIGMALHYWSNRVAHNSPPSNPSSSHGRRHS